MGHVGAGGGIGHRGGGGLSAADHRGPGARRADPDRPAGVGRGENGRRLWGKKPGAGSVGHPGSRTENIGGALGHGGRAGARALCAGSPARLPHARGPAGWGVSDAGPGGTGAEHRGPKR